MAELFRSVNYSNLPRWILSLSMLVEDDGELIMISGTMDEDNFANNEKTYDLVDHGYPLVN